MLMFADNTKLCGKVNKLEGRDAIQRDLDKPERPVCAYVMKLSKAKYKVLHLELEQSQVQIQAGREWIESSPGEKDSGVFTDRKVNMTQKCEFAIQRANHILSCIQTSMASWSREVILLLCCSRQTPPRVLHSTLGST
ncbi:hypothetical protein HGM15179_009777 [Zosterops borbonicus]|uniref:Uncharacterized protein n=1 Tax=Zosterops borbonicus TaxID=364589 RepID=A0A8K1LKV3_9PASS|nr:hypothetical protein HGM15179_009777 [Zosterops borbonicus]